MVLRPTKTTNHHGWVWVYKKIRSFGFSRFTAFYRTSLYVLRGDTGSFKYKHGWSKFRFRR
ncbi:hypothetical protein C1Y18_18455 [Pseudomonas sp. MPR-R5A]|jgi:hypothetical protein|uniref:Uncharacterized protein n=1 Tax=Pseudomonas veronii TaxID=76761 RepID=A0A5M8FA86_PSEVE|nr:hypothetical protein F3K54_20345 [Pseudomonas veronii]PMX14868.1 hypothetical protein C1Y25_13560 [Pseudomonas sp. MPBC4-3]PMX15759.1 hypothetical protein C1Y23_28285 [Pseudomonas sp. GW460-12]PMX34398.1 hypothetical protein C1Y24_14010 [Pseudomonas sp. MPR-R2A4]PMX40683.1 hypothetical protein C1Y26_13430 [Pseudomonas sp. MPR-R2A7]PMX47727.1 hypothetical protein C1Y17_30740 [Pseudomonas sp. MPR-R2A6]PMX49742.1 hypothetical protein C1Y20_05770 [Pseudomonas sp. FW301-21B01]PMX87739.1 hypoth